MAGSWHCPNCEAAATTVTDKVPWHACPGLKGLVGPLILDGSQRTRITAVPREDYTGNELVRTDDEGTAVMALNIERWDGSNDRVVYAPAVTASIESLKD